MVEDQKGQKILLKESPLSQSLPHEGLSLTIDLHVFEEFLETLFAVLVLHINIEATDLLDAAHTLHPEQQLALFLSLVFFSHALRFITTHIYILKGAFADGVVVHHILSIYLLAGVYSTVVCVLSLLLLSLIHESLRLKHLTLRCLGARCRLTHLKYYLLLTI